MSIRRLLLIPLTLLALSFASILPAGAFDRSLERHGVGAYELNAPEWAIVIDQVAEIRAEQPATLDIEPVPMGVALGPIYALSLETYGHSLLPSHYMRC